jgi:hypothetical protein
MEDLLLEPNHDALDQRVNRLIADGSDREFLDELSKLPGLVQELASSDEDRFDVPVPVVNACSAAAIALRRGKRGIVDAALDHLLAAYRTGDPSKDAADESELRLWESTVGGLWALGAAAVVAEDWDVLRSIVAREPEPGGYYSTWLRHGQVMSARGSNDPADDNIINLGLGNLRLHPGFGMTDASDDDRERAIAGFDQLALLVVASLDAPDRPGFYPSYAKFPAEFVEPHVIALRSPGPMREAIFPGGDDDLRAVLRDANEMALYQAAQVRFRKSMDWRYQGCQDARTWAFIREGHMMESWTLPY